MVTWTVLASGEEGFAGEKSVPRTVDGWSVEKKRNCNCSILLRETRSTDPSCDPNVILDSIYLVQGEGVGDFHEGRRDFNK